MNLIACSLCSAPYKPTADTHKAFCANCVGKIYTDAHVAEAHVNRINAGDMYAQPANERERETRDAARRRQLRGMT